MPALAASLAASLGSMPSLINELRRISLLSSPLIKVSMVLLDETSTMMFHGSTGVTKSWNPQTCRILAEVPEMPCKVHPTP